MHNAGVPPVEAPEIGRQAIRPIPSPSRAAFDSPIRFAVDLIPHTLSVTTLKALAPGAPVNLEVDLDRALRRADV